MIEAPEALCLSEQLNGVIKGKVVTDVIPCYTPHKFTFFNGDPEAYPGMLLGKTVDGACAYGGMVQMPRWCLATGQTSGITSLRRSYRTSTSY